MPKKVEFRPTKQPTFGLISENSRAEHAVRESRGNGPVSSNLSPHRRLKTNLGQRFVQMMATMTELARRNLRDDNAIPTADTGASIPASASPIEKVESPPLADPSSSPQRKLSTKPSSTNQSVPTAEPQAAPCREDLWQPEPIDNAPPVPALQLPSTQAKTKKRRRKPRIKRTWKTSHATWTQGQTDVNIPAYNRDSELRKLELLHTLSTLQLPSPVHTSDLSAVGGPRRSKSYTTITLRSPHGDIGADDNLSQPSDSVASTQAIDAPSLSPQALPEPRQHKTITIEMRLTLDPPRPPSPPTLIDTDKPSAALHVEPPTSTDTKNRLASPATSPPSGQRTSKSEHQGKSQDSPLIPPTPKLHRHTPTVITQEMATWLRQSRLFKLKPRHELHLTAVDQFPLSAT